MTRWIVLLRAVNVGRRQLPMAALRAACAAAGFANVRTYIASGNLLLDSDRSQAEIEDIVEAIILRDRGFHADTIARSVPTWRDYVENAPLTAERAARAKLVHLCLPKRPLAPGAAAALAARASGGEQVVEAGGALWIDSDAGLARSRLTPAAVDRAAGSPVTARNWNTVQVLLAMAEG